MPRAKTIVPDPPPSAPAQAPPRAAAGDLPADASVWEAAQRSYVEDGCSSAVVAERHGLVARTVRHHAKAQGWAGRRAAHRVATRHLDSAVDARLDPAEAYMAEQRDTQRLVLMVAPTAANSVRFAALRMQEAMAREATEEAKRWGQLAIAIDAHADVFDRAFHGADDNARLRLAYYRALELGVEPEDPAPAAHGPGPP